MRARVRAYIYALAFFVFTHLNFFEICVGGFFSLARRSFFLPAETSMKFAWVKNFRRVNFCLNTPLLLNKSVVGLFTGYNLCWMVSTAMAVVIHRYTLGDKPPS